VPRKLGTHKAQEEWIVRTIQSEGPFRPHSFHRVWVFKALQRLHLRGLITRRREGYVLTEEG
jgi:hypothetical protein